MKTIEKRSEHGNNNTLNIKHLVKECNKACMECLSCSHNHNSQLNLILQNLFNSGKNLDDIKGRDINSGCELS